jgi:hypothetical protein
MGPHLCYWHLRIGRPHGLSRGLTDHFCVHSLGVVFLVMLAGACLSMALNPVWWLACDHFLPELHRSGHDHPHCLSRHVAVVHRNAGQDLVHSFAWFRPGPRP